MGAKAGAFSWEATGVVGVEHGRRSTAVVFDKGGVGLNLSVLHCSLCLTCLRVISCHSERNGGRYADRSIPPWPASTARRDSAWSLASSSCLARPLSLTLSRWGRPGLQRATRLAMRQKTQPQYIRPCAAVCTAEASSASLWSANIACAKQVNSRKSTGLATTLDRRSLPTMGSLQARFGYFAPESQTSGSRAYCRSPLALLPSHGIRIVPESVSLTGCRSLRGKIYWSTIDTSRPRQAPEGQNCSPCGPTC
jgi:hypothetical protein